MKKIFTIGREEDCDIIIDDKTDVISRLHATLRIDPKGKMYITDQSRNGTYINGMKMTSNVEIPITRKDSVSFANIKELDWSLIPDVNRKRNIIIFSVIAVCIIGLCLWFFLGGNLDGKQIEETPKPIEETVITETKRDTVVVRDTVKIEEKKPTTVKKVEKKDSVKTVKEKEEVFNPIY